MGLAALYVAALATSVHRDNVLAHISMQCVSAAYEAMPSMLSGRLKQMGWQDPSVIKSVLGALHSIHTHSDCDEQLRSLTRNCLLAARSEMDTTDIHGLSLLSDRLRGL